MNPFSRSLAVSHQKLISRMADLVNFSYSPGDSEWSCLVAVRRFERSVREHIEVLDGYQQQFSGSHWTVRFVLESCRAQTLSLASEVHRLRMRYIRTINQGGTRFRRVNCRPGELQLHDHLDEILRVERNILQTMLDVLSVEQNKSQLYLIKSQ